MTKAGMQMKRLIAFVLAVALILTVSGSVLAEEKAEEKTWDELYAEGCAAFTAGDMEKAAEAFDASLEACGDNEIVPALMRCACAVPGRGSTLSVSLQDLEKSIRDVESLVEDLELMLAQKKISKQAYAKFAEMAESVSQYLQKYRSTLSAVEEQTKEAADSPEAAASDAGSSPGTLQPPAPASLRDCLTKPKAPSSYNEKGATAEEQGKDTVYKNKDGKILRMEWVEDDGDLVIHGVQHYVYDKDGNLTAAFTYWNNILICNFNFYRLNGNYVSQRWFDEAAIRKVFKNGGKR